MKTAIIRCCLTCGADSLNATERLMMTVSPRTAVGELTYEVY
jgi:hypothetical protein